MKRSQTPQFKIWSMITILSFISTIGCVTFHPGDISKQKPATQQNITQTFSQGRHLRKRKRKRKRAHNIYYPSITSVTKATQISLNSYTDDSWVALYGNMFSVVSINDVRVVGLDIHAANTQGITFDVKIYTSPGSYKQKERRAEEWDLIHSKEGVVGRGYGEITSLDDFSIRNVEIPSGQEQSFYVTASNMFIYTKHKSSNKIRRINKDDNVEIYAGRGNLDEFGKFSKQFTWSGNLRYEIVE